MHLSHLELDRHTCKIRDFDMNEEEKEGVEESPNGPRSRAIVINTKEIALKSKY